MYITTSIHLLSIIFDVTTLKVKVSWRTQSTNSRGQSMGWSITSTHEVLVTNSFNPVKIVGSVVKKLNTSVGMVVYQQSIHSNNCRKCSQTAMWCAKLTMKTSCSE